MAAVPLAAGRLRDCVRFERRSVGGDGYGNSEGDWAPLVGDRRASLLPTRGGELVIADRLQGVSHWDLWLRFDVGVAAVTTDDQVIDARDPLRVFAIKAGPLDLDGDRRWLLFQLELGSAN